ncbi:MAG: N-acetylmuramic acid 6-phosphate etherase [Planctomycetota bacterium]|nr:N-acetylmuramic acid 6-phosphate etherase [Planctomycetota bacterium]
MNKPDPALRASCEKLATEAPNPATADLGRLASVDPVAAVGLMLEADRGLLDALSSASIDIAAVARAAATALESGGRLIYIGAGTSGRLGVLDAVECPPTFQVDDSRVVGILAGGHGAMFAAVEGIEDNPEAGARDLAEHKVGPLDLVVGISASASAPYVHGAIAHANSAGAATAMIACVTKAERGDEATLSVRIPTGPESLAGSTRLRAGTATKMALNMISTLAMAARGKVHGNLMVDVNTAGNHKLLVRGRGLVVQLVPCNPDRAAALLNEAGGAVKVAVVMGRKGLNQKEAKARLDQVGGVLGDVLG